MLCSHVDETSRAFLTPNERTLIRPCIQRIVCLAAALKCPPAQDASFMGSNTCKRSSTSIHEEMAALRRGFSSEQEVRSHSKISFCSLANQDRILETKAPRQEQQIRDILPTLSFPSRLSAFTPYDERLHPSMVSQTRVLSTKRMRRRSASKLQGLTLSGMYMNRRFEQPRREGGCF